RARRALLKWLLLGLLAASSFGVSFALVTRSRRPVPAPAGASYGTRRARSGAMTRRNPTLRSGRSKAARSCATTTTVRATGRAPAWMLAGHGHVARRIPLRDVVGAGKTLDLIGEPRIVAPAEFSSWFVSLSEEPHSHEEIDTTSASYPRPGSRPGSPDR